jgi:hypothetical protein
LYLNIAPFLGQAGFSRCHKISKAILIFEAKAPFLETTQKLSHSGSDFTLGVFSSKISYA